MTEPKVADNEPAILDLEPGTYYWCRCGLSENQPYCNGSHDAAKFLPMEFTLETKKKVALCQCKHTGNAPFCDGSHKNLTN